MSGPHYRKAGAKSGDRKQRRCLVCGGFFNSAGPENRICPKHRRKRTKYDDWAETSSDALDETSRNSHDF